MEELNDAVLKQDVLDSVGLGENSAALDRIDAWWSMYASEKTKQLRYLRTKAHAAKYLMGQLRLLFNTQQGSDRADMRQQFQNVQEILSATEAEIRELKNPSGPSKAGSSTPKTSWEGASTQDRFYHGKGH